MTGHILATDPRGQSLLPKSAPVPVTKSTFAKGESVVYRVIRGTAEFRAGAGKVLELGPGDTITAGKGAIALIGIGENTQILRLGLLEGI